MKNTSTSLFYLLAITSVLISSRFLLPLEYLLIGMPIMLIASIVYVYSLGLLGHKLEYSLLAFSISLVVLFTVYLLSVLKVVLGKFLLLGGISTLFITLYILVIFIFKYILKDSKLDNTLEYDSEGTAEFAEIGKNSGVNLRIYKTFRNLTVNSKFDRKEGCLNVFFNTEFASTLTKKEVSAAILHEIGHYKTGRVIINIYTIPVILYAYLLGYSYFIISPPAGALESYLYIGILVAMILSFYYVVKKFTIVLERKEYMADEYAVSQMDEISSLLSLLSKVQEHYRNQAFFADSLRNEITDSLFLNRKLMIEEKGLENIKHK